jgi:hypothetical protein
VINNIHSNKRPQKANEPTLAQTYLLGKVERQGPDDRMSSTRIESGET